jgi:hypothetical protein
MTTICSSGQETNGFKAWRDDVGAKMFEIDQAKI